MSYESWEILDSERELWEVEGKVIDHYLEEHGMNRGTGEDEYNGKDNLQELLECLGY